MLNTLRKTKYIVAFLDPSTFSVLFFFFFFFFFFLFFLLISFHFEFRLIDRIRFVILSTFIVFRLSRHQSVVYFKANISQCNFRKRTNAHANISANWTSAMIGVWQKYNHFCLVMCPRVSKIVISFNVNLYNWQTTGIAYNSEWYLFPFRIETAFYYAPNFEEFRGVYCFWFARLRFRSSVRPSARHAFWCKPYPMIRAC